MHASKERASYDTVGKARGFRATLELRNANIFTYKHLLATDMVGKLHIKCN